MLKKIILILIVLTSMVLLAGQSLANNTYDIAIEYHCNQYELSNQYQFGTGYGTNAERCTLIGQAQYRFENSTIPNNIFGLKRKNFMKFKTPEESIIFWVKRYYTYEYRKTISQIIKGGCYYNLQEEWTCFNGYTLTSHHQNNYYNFVRSYFINNINK